MEFVVLHLQYGLFCVNFALSIERNRRQRRMLVDQMFLCSVDAARRGEQEAADPVAATNLPDGPDGLRIDRVRVVRVERAGRITHDRAQMNDRVHPANSADHNFDRAEVSDDKLEA